MKKKCLSGFSSIVLALSVTVCLLFLASCTQSPEPAANNVDLSSEMVVPESYEEVYDLIKAIESASETSGNSIGLLDLLVEDTSSDEAASSNDIATSDSPTSSSSGDYSETNTQVAGIDEADIVKTDGNNIYLVSGYDVVIAQAAGEETEEIARISLDVEVLRAKGITDEVAVENASINPLELYIHGDTLVVLYQYYPTLLPGQENTNTSSYSYYYSRAVSEAAFFDISNALEPHYLKTIGQDGAYSTSRLYDGILYLVSSYYEYGITMERENPSTYMPVLYADATQDIIPAPHIGIFPDTNSLSFTVVSSVDVTSTERLDAQSVLGSNSTVYMSPDNLYLAGSHYSEMATNSYEDGSFEVTEYVQSYDTRLTRLALDQGSIALQASGAINGALLNQFSLDEHQGYLRVVTSVDMSSYRTLEDEKGVVNDYSYESTPTTNALFVLDSALEIVGSIEGLAEEEQVYSVRFDGDVGYFVTFRQTDPLFAVDLSNPTNPEIRSELKIPGFSTYMHLYDNDRLLGLGMAATDTGRTTGLKLSMFDTTDPYDITEKHTLELDYSYSEALYDHKAVFVDLEHNIIGFPVSKGYAIYGYSDEDGFSLRESFTFKSSYSYSSMRGLFVNSFLYLCSESNIGVYTLDMLEEVAEIPIEVKGNTYSGIMPLGIEE